MRRRRPSRVGAFVLSGLLVTGPLAACAPDDALPAAGSSPSISSVPASPLAPVDTGAPRPTATPSAQASLRVLVTNDDGVKAAGIDALARALGKVPGVRVSIVAPATNQSGTGSATTTGRLRHRPTTTASGIRATAVTGYPADAVRVALDDLELDPALVVSGVNQGANAGSAVPLSGTVGAARAAIARGIPAVAASAAPRTPDRTADFGPAAKLVAEWVRTHRAALLAGAVGARTLLNVNTPACRPLRGVEQVPVAKGDVRPGVSDCRSTVTRPRDDVAALNAGFVALSRVPALLATPYPR